MAAGAGVAAVGDAGVVAARAGACAGGASLGRPAEGRHSSTCGLVAGAGCGAGVEASGAAGAVSIAGSSGCSDSTAAFLAVFFLAAGAFFTAGFAAFVTEVFAVFAPALVAVVLAASALVFGAATVFRFVVFFGGAGSSASKGCSVDSVIMGESGQGARSCARDGSWRKRAGSQPGIVTIAPSVASKFTMPAALRDFVDRRAADTGGGKVTPQVRMVCGITAALSCKDRFFFFDFVRINDPHVWSGAPSRRVTLDHLW